MPADQPIPVPDYGLKCRHCGYLLAGLPRYVCPECGEAFTLEEFIPSGEFPGVFAEGRAVHLGDDVRRLMSTYQIPVMEKRGVSESLMLAVGTKVHAPGQLCVPRECYFEVLDLLRRARLGIQLPQPPVATPATDDWSCAKCGETNPGNFDICWSCESVRP